MGTKKNLAEAWGLWRSLLMYYAIPGRGEAWRKFYCQRLLPGEVAFDIGAHVGNRTRAMANTGSPVVAVEASGRMVAVLRRLYGRRETITILEKAVGAEAGQAQLLASRRHPTVSTLSGGWADQVGATRGFAGVTWEDEELVEVTTLDALIAEYGMPGFCKLDIEGYELEALKGLSSPIRNISFEYIPAAREIALGCVARLGELGDYQFNLIRGEAPKYLAERWMEADEVQELLSGLPNEDRAGEVVARIRVNA